MGEKTLLQRCRGCQAELQARASSDRERRAKDPDARGSQLLPIPYLLLRRWRRRLLGPAVLSWFRAAGQGRCGRRAGAGRARAGAALGAGPRGSGKGGRRPLPQAAERMATLAPG